MAIETVRILCASCGAALAIPPDLDQISCAHCGTPLTIVHGDGFVAARLAQAVTRTIETSAAATQAELRRLQLQQERFSVQERIADLEAEERAIRRTELGGGLVFPSAQLTAVQREWNHAVLELNRVEDQLGLKRSYVPINSGSAVHFPQDARPWGVALFVIGFLVCFAAPFTGAMLYLFVGIVLMFVGYGAISALTRR